MNATGDLVLLARAVGGLVVVLVVVALAARLARRGRKFTGGDQLQVVSRVGLTREASIAVVQAGERSLLLGVTATGVALLAELDDEEQETVPPRPAPRGDYRGLTGLAPGDGPPDDFADDEFLDEYPDDEYPDDDRTQAGLFAGSGDDAGAGEGPAAPSSGSSFEGILAGIAVPSAAPDHPGDPQDFVAAYPTPETQADAIFATLLTGQLPTTAATAPPAAPGPGSGDVPRQRSGRHAAPPVEGPAAGPSAEVPAAAVPRAPEPPARPRPQPAARSVLPPLPLPRRAALPTDVDLDGHPDLASALRAAGRTLQPPAGSEEAPAPWAAWAESVLQSVEAARSAGAGPAPVATAAVPVLPERRQQPRPEPQARQKPGRQAPVRPKQASGSVLSPATWRQAADALRDRTVRRG